MVKGLYSAYTGMLSEQKRLDIISNNVANAATTGYKKEGVTNQAFDELLTLKIKDATNGYADQEIGGMSLGVKIGEVYTNYGQGSFRQTSNTFDLAIEGNGFFTMSVIDKAGNESIKYTRDGSFKVTTDGYVVDVDGNRLMGEGGYIQIPESAQKITIDNTGILYVDGEYVDDLQITDFEDYNALEKFGNNLYGATEEAVEKDAAGTIYQGYLEQSNVQSVEEMINMMTVTRAYEANQKVIHTIDSMLDKAVNQVGKL